MGLVKTSVASHNYLFHDSLLIYLRYDFVSYPQLVGVRILLGVAEAGLFPGVVY
jgi:hypothetical protein